MSFVYMFIDESTYEQDGIGQQLSSSGSDGGDDGDGVGVGDGGDVGGSGGHKQGYSYYIDDMRSNVYVDNGLPSGGISKEDDFGPLFDDDDGDGDGGDDGDGDSGGNGGRDSVEEA